MTAGERSYFKSVDVFNKDNHYRVADKCCGNCKFSNKIYDELRSCNNKKYPKWPWIDKNQTYTDSPNHYVASCVDSGCVCDLWELAK